MCTCLRITAKDNSIIIGRTMEFGIDPGSKITVFPRGFQYEGIGPEGKKGFSWRGQYGFVGVNVSDLPKVSDGLNEKGLYVGALYLPGFTKYQDIASDKENISICQLDVAGYLLSSCATVEDAKKAIQEVLVSGLYVDQIKEIPPLHYQVTDESGKSIVLEYVDGNLITHENPLGILTNAPTFDWHIINLRNFINLSATTVPELQLQDGTIKQLGEGTGMLGLPGDATPPSRFVRAAAFTQSALQPEDSEKALNLTYHIMNNFDLPLGFSRYEAAGQTMYDFTFWTTFSDLKNKAYYYRGYNNVKVFKISLDKLDFSATELKYPDTSSTDWFEEIM